MTTNLRKELEVWLKEKRRLAEEARVEIKEKLAQIEAELSEIQILELKLLGNNSQLTTPAGSYQGIPLTLEVEDDNLLLSRRSPKEMLKPIYEGKALVDVAQVTLDGKSESVSADDIAKLIFITNDYEEFDRARNSLATELRRGAKEGRWKQVGRGRFASNSVIDLAEETEEEEISVPVPDTLSLDNGDRPRLVSTESTSAHIGSND